MEIAADTHGEEFTKVMEKVLNIRESRRELYGDDFSAPIDVDLWAIYQKIGRALKHRENEKHRRILAYESMEDNLIDIVNYAVFALIKLSPNAEAQRKFREENFK